MTRTREASGKSLRRAHAALLRDFRRLEESLKGPVLDSPAALGTRLRTTRDDLQAHFHFEEVDGYMDAVRRQAPQFERVVNQLAEEHIQLMQSLDSLIEFLSAASTVDEPIRDRVRQWIDRVRQHEARENDVVQEAALMDIGAED